MNWSGVQHLSSQAKLYFEGSWLIALLLQYSSYLPSLEVEQNESESSGEESDSNGEESESSGAVGNSSATLSTFGLAQGMLCWDMGGEDTGGLKWIVEVILCACCSEKDRSNFNFFGTPAMQ